MDYAGSLSTVVVCFVFFVVFFVGFSPFVRGQTEGDTGYEYNYDDEFYDESALSQGPTFDVPMTNVTVVIGQTAVLPCSIDYLGKHKVAWLDQNSFPLTYEDRRVIDDSRFSVIRPQDKEWNLQVHEVKADDDGQYRCTINTNPVRSKIVMLRVCVPPEILDDQSSHDVTVQEGDSVALVCVANGRPQPEITWYRSNGAQKCHLGTGTIGYLSKGSQLLINNISRYCDGRYECEASNGVPASFKRHMIVTVEFAPQISMPNRRLGQIKGRRETILNCIITANPHATNYWEKDGRRIHSSLKHYIDTYDEGDNTLTLSLRITDLTHADYGQYRCIAANALGRDEDVVFLFEADPEVQVLMVGGSVAPPGGPQRTFFRLGGGGGGGGGGAGGPSTSGAAASARLDDYVAPRLDGQDADADSSYYNTPAYKRLPQTNDRVLLNAIRIVGGVGKSSAAAAAAASALVTTRWPDVIACRSKHLAQTVLVMTVGILLRQYL